MYGKNEAKYYDPIEENIVQSHTGKSNQSPDNDSIAKKVI